MSARQYRQREQGATALIIVMFFTLMMTVMAVGFVQMMVREQKASQDSELSQGAYDSALAGAEDGKRVLRACINGDTAACAAIDAGRCNTVSAARFVNDSPDGSVIQSKRTGGSNGSEYSQAYTCVKISRNTKNIEDQLENGASTVKQLRAMSGAAYNRVTVQWFTKADSSTISFAPSRALGVFTPVLQWGPSRPPVLRLQLIQYKDGDLKVDDLDLNGGSNTLYLYPTQNGMGGDLRFADDGRTAGGRNRAPAASPKIARCVSSRVGQYACQATILLPNPIRGTAANRSAFLRVTSLYNKASFSVSLQNNSTPVMFEGVQPSIDSTGRAADVYRRVVERVELSDPLADTMLYPRATVDTTDSFCKAMVLTDDPNDFTTSCS